MGTIKSALLHRIDPEKNEARFYFLLVVPSLIDPYAVLRVWGRLGGQQRQMATPCASAEEAQALAGRLMKRRLRRGYWLVYPTAMCAEEGVARDE